MDKIKFISDNVVEEIIKSSIWKTTSIDETPSIELARWSVYEVSSEIWPEKTCHFVGYNLTEREGRVSSAIIEFDEQKMIGKTKSGRVYKLQDSPGYDSDGQWVWNYFVNRNKLSEIKNVTDNYWRGTWD